MTTMDLPASRPARLPRLAAMVCDHNPFYLLSGVCLLAGGFAINLAAHERDDGAGLLALLVAVFAVYEVLILGLGVYLYRSRGLARDAAVLLGLELLLLVDVTLLHHELFTASGALGSGVAAVVVMLGVVKVAVLDRGLTLNLDGRIWAAVVVGLVGVYGLPGALRWLKWLEVLDREWFLAAWWAVAGVIVAASLVRPHAASPTRLGAALRRGVVLAPVVSVGWHLALAHWQFEVAWTPAMAGPVLVALAASMALGWGDALAASTARRWAVVLGAAAMVLAATDGGGLEPWSDWTTPLRVTAMATIAVWGGVGWRRGGSGPWLASLGGVAVSLAGPTPTAIAANVRWLWEEVFTTVERLTPRSALSWGLLGVMAAFVLLALGAVTSLARRRVER